ncbi:MAG TPA: hypothetical protein VD963_06695 [Phycisphaerales bacterium]|nr:hypothetical protein [Phycisphaerales bacterium]
MPVVAPVPATVLACVLAVVFPARAQQQPTPGSAQPPRPVMPSQTEPVDVGPQVSVNFPGGTLQQFVEQLRAASGEDPANIVCHAETSSIAVPPIQLQHVTVGSALAALNYLTYGSERPVSVTVIDGPAPVLAVAPMHRSAAGVSTSVFSLAEIIGAAAGEERQRRVQPVLMAIEAALLFSGGQGNARFHEDSGLLMVRGSHDDLQLVHSVIAALRDEARQREHQQAAQRVRESRILELQQHSLRQIEELRNRQQSLTERQEVLRTSGIKEGLEEEVRELELQKRDIERRIAAAEREMKDAARLVDVGLQGPSGQPAGDLERRIGALEAQLRELAASRSR